MNDYVAKPINVDRMLATLARWVPERAPAAAPVKTVATPPPGGLPDALPGLDLADGLKRVGGDRALYRRLLMQFRDHSGKAPDEMRAALAAGDRATAKSAAHTLKGVAGTLSAMELYQAAQKLESALRKGAPNVDAELEVLAAAHGKLMSGLAQLQAQAPAEGSPLRTAELRKLLDDLDQRLLGSDASAVQALDALKGALNGSHGTFITEIERLIVTYEFEDARGRLARFAETLK
jgi:two-component system sensor histidine kinase/response regulator